MVLAAAKKRSPSTGALYRKRAFLAQLYLPLARIAVIAAKATQFEERFCKPTATVAVVSARSSLRVEFPKAISSNSCRC